MHEPSTQNEQAAFWHELACLIERCAKSSDQQRDDAWRALRLKLRDWTRRFAHEKGVRRDDAKEEFCDFMLTWLALPGRLSSFDAKRGHFSTWYRRAMEMGYQDWAQENQPRVLGGDVGGAPTEVVAPDRRDALIRDARDVLIRLPLALRTAFK